MPVAPVLTWPGVPISLVSRLAQLKSTVHFVDGRGVPGLATVVPAPVLSCLRPFLDRVSRFTSVVHGAATPLSSSWPCNSQQGMLTCHNLPRRFLIGSSSQKVSDFRASDTEFLATQ